MAQWDRCQSDAAGMERWMDVAGSKRLKEENFILDSQLTHTCSKLTIETLEKGMKYVQS